MADTISVVTIYPWPHFSAYRDTLPVVGGQLYTYAPNSSTPKAAYADPFFSTPLANPAVLDEHGELTIYLDGHYDLRLFDAEDVLLWSVQDYTFSSGVTPVPGTIQFGSNSASIAAVDGAGQLSSSTLVPTGARLLGLAWTITTGFGTSHGLNGLAIGDSTALDSWAQTTNLSAGATGGQQQMRRGDELIASVPYTVLVSGLGGTFDATGILHVTATWATINADVP